MTHQNTNFTKKNNLTTRQEIARRRIYPDQDPRWIRRNQEKKFIDIAAIMEAQT